MFVFCFWEGRKDPLKPPRKKNGIETIGPEPGRFSVLPGREREVGNVCTGL